VGDLVFSFERVAVAGGGDGRDREVYCVEREGVGSGDHSVVKIWASDLKKSGGVQLPLNVLEPGVDGLVSPLELERCLGAGDPFAGRRRQTLEDGPVTIVTREDRGRMDEGADEKGEKDEELGVHFFD